MMSWIKRTAFRLAWRVLAFLGISRLNYYRHYARPDIDQKYKILMGCESEEEFDETGKRIFAQLVSLGLKPHSKVLDLGCGTGRLATQLLSYFADDGEYYGCDISAEAVEFCKKRYVRSNFHFVTNHMTRIPLTLDAHFDFIWCYSVFTHVYPIEMTALIRECSRLLKPQSLLLASYYIAGREPAFLKSVKTLYGNRDRLEYGENYLHGILKEQRASILGTVSIQKQPILILRFQQPPTSTVDARESRKPLEHDSFEQ